MTKRSNTGEPTPQTSFAVGRECEAWCGKCKESTYHTVVAMIGPKPKQVACGACNDWHGYSKPRAPTVETTQAPVRRRAVQNTGAHRGRVRPERGTATTSEDRWKAALDAATGEPLLYDHRDSYAVGDVVQHPKHGLCVVKSTETPRRATVLHRHGEGALLTSGVRNK